MIGLQGHGSTLHSPPADVGDAPRFAPVHLGEAKSHLLPSRAHDKPETLPYSISPIFPDRADGEQRQEPDDIHSAVSKPYYVCVTDSFYLTVDW